MIKVNLYYSKTLNDTPFQLESYIRAHDILKKQGFELFYFQDQSPSDDGDIHVVFTKDYEHFLNKLVKPTIIECWNDSADCIDLQLLNNPHTKLYNKVSKIKKEYINSDIDFFKLSNADFSNSSILLDNYHKLNAGIHFGMFRIVRDYLKMSQEIIDRDFSMNSKSIDVNCIMSAFQNNWRLEYRTKFLQNINKLKNSTIYTALYVQNKNEFMKLDKKIYFNMLNQSKITISPWGLGETCFRDFEAFLSNSILIKPKTEFSEILNHPYKINQNTFYCDTYGTNLEEVIEYALNTSTIQYRKDVYNEMIKINTDEFAADNIEKWFNQVIKN